MSDFRKSANPFQTIEKARFWDHLSLLCATFRLNIPHSSQTTSDTYLGNFEISDEQFFCPAQKLQIMTLVAFSVSYDS